jgi:hypothetical protein
MTAASWSSGPHQRRQAVHCRTVEPCALTEAAQRPPRTGLAAVSGATSRRRQSYSITGVWQATLLLIDAGAFIRRKRGIQTQGSDFRKPSPNSLLLCLGTPRTEPGTTPSRVK